MCDLKCLTVMMYMYLLSKQSHRALRACLVWQLNNLAQLDSFLVVYFKRLADELPIRLQFKQAPFLLRLRICLSYLFPQLDGTTNFVHVSGKKCSTTKDLKTVLSERKILWTGWDMVRSSRTEPNKPEAQQMSPRTRRRNPNAVCFL